MKRLVLLLIAFVAIVLLVGCSSHNVVTYSDGIGFESTMRPDTGNLGITFRYGKILSAIVRENTEVAMQGDGSTSGATSEKAPSANAGANGSVQVKVGRQITGYYVDAIKAGVTADQLDKYTAPSAPPQ